MPYSRKERRGLMKKRKRISPMLTPVITGLMCLMLVLSLIIPDQDFSQTENRPLSRGADLSPAALYSGKSQQEINRSFTDQIPMRNGFFHLNYLVRKLSGQREINDVFLGKGALLANPEAPRQEVWQANSAAVSAFASQSGLPCYLLIAPGAANIQPEKLPANAPAVNPNEAIDASYAAAAPAASVDVRPVLGEHKQEYIYYKTDHHWTTLGAGYGMTALMGAMGIGLDLASYKQMPVTGDFEGTLASKTGSLFLKDTIDIAVANNNPEYVVTWADGSKTGSIYNKDALNQKDKYQVFLSENQSMIRIDIDNDSQRHLLLFKDSYANSTIQYLLPFYSSITIIDPRYYYDDLDLVLSSGEITECAFIYSADTWDTISSLQGVLQTYTPAQ